MAAPRTMPEALSPTPSSQAASLRRLIRAYAETLTADRAAAEAIRACVEGIGASGGVVALLDEDHRGVRLLAAAGYSAAAVDAWRSASPAVPAPLAEPLRTGQPVWIASEDGEWQTSESAGPHTLAAVPLRMDGRVTGALGVTFREERAYDEGERRFLEDVADLCIQALERVRLHAAERLARADALAAARARRDFLAVAAHELKTPITSLRGYAQLTLRRLARRGQLDASELRGYMVGMDQQAARLARLVGLVLDVTRLEDGRLLLDRQEVDLVPALQRIVAAAQQMTDHHTIEWQAPQALRAVVDPVRIEQVLASLLENSIKFSPEDGGPIEVRLELSDPRTVRLTVMDHGIGIPIEQRERVFERYHQVHAGRHFAGMVGMGLGLYVSRAVVREHGGHLTLEEPAGGGTRAVVLLPTSRGVDEGSSATAGSRGPVLVVDDDAGIREVAAQVLREEGYTVVTAPNGHVALELLRGLNPAPCLILLDVRMPYMDGRAFAEAYHQTSGLHAPIVLFTASADPASRGALPGVVAGLEKPFQVAALLEVVARHANGGATPAPPLDASGTP